MFDLGMWLLTIGALLTMFSLVFAFLVMLLELIFNTFNFKWFYFINNLSYYLGFPMMIIGIIIYIYLANKK